MRNLARLLLVGISFLISSFSALAGAVSIPMTFERNDGQAPRQYRFLSHHQGIQALFSAKGPDFVVPLPNSNPRQLGMRFLAAAESPSMNGEQPLTGRANYLRGRQVEKWITSIPTFGQVRYSNLYPGIDLVFHADEAGSELEHDFELRPGTDPKSIQFEMSGADAIRLRPDGQLSIEVQGKSIIFHQPAAYQETRSGRVAVAAKFRLDGHRVVGFQLGKYDRQTPLTIDPVLSFATYLDGSNNDTVRGLVSDASGNIYVAGSTYSTDFPLINPVQSTNMGQGDAFVAKLDPTGHTLAYATYLGGQHLDEAESIAVDANGNVVISGTSQSSDFPQAGLLTSPATSSVETFVASLNAAGSTLRYCGFLAADQPVQQSNDTRLSRVAVDTQGNGYVAGLTDDPSFTITSGAYGGPVSPYPSAPILFLAKVKPDGSFGYKATIPQTQPLNIGSTTPPLMLGNITVDSTGAVILAGYAGNVVPTTTGTLSPNFPNSLLPVNAIAGFVLKLNAAGSALAFSTYLPGTDIVNDVALDAAGDLYVAGTTNESTLPTSAHSLQKTLVTNPNGSGTREGFVFKLRSDGTTAINATYFEGVQSPGETDIGGLVVDSAGNVDIAGETAATDLPLKYPLLSIINNIGADDLFVAQLSADLSTLQFNTFLHASDNSAQLTGLSAASSNQILVSGATYSTIFPTTAGSFQPAPPPSASNQTLYPRVLIAGLNLSVAAPSLCFDPTSVNFGDTLVNAITKATVNVTNCGNAPLTLSSVTSSDPTVTVTQNCGGIAPAGVCQLQLAYAPTAAGSVRAAVTISGNNVISPQIINYIGTAGYPQVSLPSSLSFDDLLVGQTGSTNDVFFYNQGQGPFLFTSATATGDFQVTQNFCKNPVPVNSDCYIEVNFNPTAVGSRTGVLTLTDNLNPAVQTIQLSGNGLTTAPPPTITQIPATPIAASGLSALVVAGTGFFPNSMVTWNGQPRPTHYTGERQLIVDLLPADIQQVGEAQVLVSTPAPGGGTSAASTATVYGRLKNIQVMNEVFDPHSQLIYATVNKASPTNANSVVAIDPVAMKVVKTVLMGNSPDAIAVSDDGSLLYVGLDDLLSVTQIALPGGTQNFTLVLPAPPSVYPSVVASGLAVVPGQAHTWLAGLCASSGEPCGVGVAVFDDQTVRPTFESDAQLGPNGFVFVNDPTVVYASEIDIDPENISAYKISSSGIQRTATSAFLPSVGGVPLESDGTFLYDRAGQVIDPSTLVVQSTYPQAITADEMSNGFNLDTANKRLYFAGLISQDSMSPYGGLLLSVVGQKTMSTLGQIQFPEGPVVYTVERFGANGLAIDQGDQWLFLQTSLTGTAIGGSLAISPASVSFAAQTQGTTSAAQTVTVTNNGTVALSITGITTTGDYSQTNTCGTSLAVSASCAVSVSFTPTATGDRMGQLTLADNAASTPQSVSLDGMGTAAVPVLSASVSPASLSFASQTQGTTSPAQTVTLTNTGAAALSITGIMATGDFSESDTCGTALAVSASCVVSIRFTPTATGDRTGTVTIADNASGAPETVSLDGTGTAALPPLTLGPQSSGGNSATVAAGGTATYTLTLMTAAYTGAIQLTCTGAPALATCSINPAAPNVTAGAPTPITVTVATASSASSALAGPARPGDAQRQILSAGLGVMALVSLPLIIFIRRYRSSFVGVLLVSLVFGLGLVGCGGGSTATPVNPVKNVAAGTYLLTITASANNQVASQVLTLTVQ